MELENVIEQTIEPVVETVSTEPVVEVVEWKAPASKEELDKLLKAESSRVYTKALKELGVTSVKEFKELQAKIESERTNLETIVKERDQSVNTVKELSAKYNSLVQENLLNELNIEQEYRDDLIKLAQDKVSDEKPLSDVLKEMVEGKYKYAVAQPGRIKMSVEKTNSTKVETEKFAKSTTDLYPWLKK